MIPTAQEKRTAHIESGVVDEFMMRMSGDVTDAIFVLKTLTDLYSIRPLAVIRETTTNAWDSHVLLSEYIEDTYDRTCRTFARIAPDAEAQGRIEGAERAAAARTRPFLVTLPQSGATTPMFVVQDFGVGLNAKDMDDIYVQFGKSLKRNSATATGMLGLGSKAPLTYASSFTVVGVKDGIKTVAVITRLDTGLGTCKVLSVSGTDEENGVTLSVPVPPEDVGEFNKLATEFFSYWREGVLVDGQPPQQVKTVLELDQDLHVLDVPDRYSRQRSVIVQGNVPYKYATPRGLPATVAYVEMGTVEFTPSREELDYVDKTKQAIETISEVVEARLDRYIKAEIDAAPNTYERYRVMLRLRRSLQAVSYYRSDLLTPSRHDTEFRQQSYRDDKTVGHYAWAATRDVNEFSRTESLYDEWITDDGWVFITGFPFKSVSPVHKEKLAHNGITSKVVLVSDLCRKIPLDGFPTRHWDTLQDVPKEKRQPTRTTSASRYRTKTRYDFVLDGRTLPCEEWEGDETVVYVVTTNFSPWDEDAGARYLRALTEIFPDVAFVPLMSTQENKFTRLHPKAKRWTEWVPKAVAKLEKKLTLADHAYMEAEPWERHLSNYYADLASQVKDPQLRAHMVFRQSDTVSRLLAVRNGLSNSGLSIEISQKLANLQPYGYTHPPYASYPAVHYPLFSADFTRAPEEWLYYLNAKYKAVKKAQRDAAAADDDTAAA